MQWQWVSQYGVAGFPQDEWGMQDTGGSILWHEACVRYRDDEGAKAVGASRQRPVVLHGVVELRAGGVVWFRGAEAGRIWQVESGRWMWMPSGSDANGGRAASEHDAVCMLVGSVFRV